MHTERIGGIRYEFQEDARLPFATLIVASLSERNSDIVAMYAAQAIIPQRRPVPGDPESKEWAQTCAAWQASLRSLLTGEGREEYRLPTVTGCPREAKVL